MSKNIPYKLRCSLPGHSKDVRCVTVGEIVEECIVSGSRDKTAKLWLPEGYVLLLAVILKNGLMFKTDA